MSTARPGTMSEYPDRTTTLIIAGVLEVMLGCLCGLMALMMLVLSLAGPIAPPQGQAPPVPAASGPALIQAAIVYVVPAVAFLWIGIGLVGARRWAWTLTVVFSWTWLVIGVLSFFFFLCFMGQSAWAAIAAQSKAPPETITVMRIGASVAVFCIYILVPGVFLLLCHHASVRATCLRRDPQTRWTDRCPMPVLAPSILLALSVISMFSLAAYNWTVPLFGGFISGAAGAAVVLLLAVVLAYLAWGTYRLQRAAWWGALLLGIVGTANMAITFSRNDLGQMYQKMGMPPDQLEMIRKMGMIDSMSRWGPWMGLAGGAFWLGYLLYIRRYFFRSNGDSTTSPSVG